jgi:hypothetical protein
MTIINGPNGDYLFYKTIKMKKPQFYDLKQFYNNTKNDYKSCDINTLKIWLKETYNIS